MVYRRGKMWWYKFTWNRECIRESTKQSNKRVAEQIESAHKASLAKGEVGIREKRVVPTLRQFAPEFESAIRTQCAEKPPRRRALQRIAFCGDLDLECSMVSSLAQREGAVIRAGQLGSSSRHIQHVLRSVEQNSHREDHHRADQREPRKGNLDRRRWEDCWKIQ